MLLSPLETIILVIIMITTFCWWRLHGQRETALSYASQHCKKLNLTLLDDYVALKTITFKKDGNNKLRLANIYNFEFTVTGEQRYTASITLFGNYLDKIELPPYISNTIKSEEDTTTIIEQTPANIIYLEKYPRYHKKL